MDAPAWVEELEAVAPKVRRAPRRRPEFVPHPCLCLSYANTRQPSPKRKRMTCAADLCHNGPTLAAGNGCQVYGLFRLAVEHGDHPADMVELYHWFTPTSDDRDHLDWVCLLNCRDWLMPHELRIYAGIPEPKRLHKPRDFMRLPDAEVKAFYAAKATECRAIATDLAAIEIRETTFARFLAVYLPRLTARRAWEAEQPPEPAAVFPFEPFNIFHLGMDPNAPKQEEHHTH